MSDQAKVRLVRCPKCEELLPELQGYSVYQCGGCGALLKAQYNNLEMDSSSQKSDKESVQVVEDKPDNFSFEKKSFKEGSDNDIRSNGSSSRRDITRNEKLKAETWVDDDRHRNDTLHGFSHAGMEREYRDLGPSNGTKSGSQRSESFSDWRDIDRRELEDVLGNRKQDFQALRYSRSMYREDGPSNYPFSPSYGFREPKNSRDGADELSKVEYLEQDRAELLKKLDELKDQISRSCDINDKHKEKVLLDQMMAREEVTFPKRPLYASQVSATSPYTDRSCDINGKHKERVLLDRTMARDEGAYPTKPLYASQYSETSPYIGRHEVGPRRYSDPLSYQMLKTSHQEPNLHLPEHHLHNKIDPYQQPYPRDMNLHHPRCSCVHCYNHHSRVSPSVPPVAFQNKALPHEPYNPMLYRHENHRAFDLLDYNSNKMNSNPLSTRNLQSHPRWSSDLNFDVHGYGSHRSLRTVKTTGRRRCLPFAGGAPLVSCYNCFQLLELPKKFSSTKTKHVRVKCGACSTIIIFAIVDNKLISVSVDTNMTPDMAVKNPNLAVRGSAFNTHVRGNQVYTNSSSEDYDNSGYIFQLLNTEGQGFGSNKSDNMRSFNSVSSYSSEHEVSLDSMNAQEGGFNSVELEADTVLSPPLAGSALRNHFDYPDEYQFKKGNQSGRSESEQADLRKITHNDSTKDASLATEMEVSFGEDINTGTSFESGETSKDEDQIRGSKGAQKFFAGIIKKSFKDFKSNSIIDQKSTNVMINGHPITERLLKKAEETAGPVHAGQYWYDSRAGFWGVIGGPCLGIIPPFIEEFNHPMPENCAGGNTGVFVNGRELHQKDLKLLSSRGLPSTGNRSYIVEMSGRVLDEDTGEELPSLGKLAPTVEKVKHGFGMKVPRLVT